MEVIRSHPRPARLPLVLLIVGLLLAAGSRGSEPAVDLQQYRGKVVLLDFWASWCVPCRHSFPWMNRMQETYSADGLVIVGVNMDAAAEDADTFLRETPAGFRIVYDPDGDLARRFDVEAMPSSYVIDRNGQVVAQHLGFREKMKDEYEARIREVLHLPEE